MANNITQITMEKQARSIARRTFSGSRGIVKRKENHLVFISLKIYNRWKIGPYDWKAKHLRWFLESTKDRSNGTRYRYFRILRSSLKTTDTWIDVKHHLSGSWEKP